MKCIFFYLLFFGRSSRIRLKDTGNIS
uniref:Uncharacterized protein n=1 Tax=Anguilla anguilla TaxID=7936 RepID=A0A0E9QDF6_ANGAN